MKRFVLILLAFLFILSAPTFTLAQETLDGFQYRVEKDESITITGYSGSDVNLQIPIEIDGKRVKEIGNGTFSQNTALEHVTIPEGIIKIGNGAFSHCRYIVNVDLPSTLTMIGEAAFENCESLQSINIPDGVKEIPANTFSGLRSMEEIVLPSSIQQIGNYAFGGSSLKSIKLNEGLVKIDQYAINNCYMHENIVIPNSVKEIGRCAFSQNEKLTSVVISSGIKEIRDNMFTNDKALVKVAIPKSVVRISNDILTNCFKVSIWGFKGSTAETFAKKNDIPFVTVDPVKEVKILLNGEDVTKAKLFIDLNTDITSMQLTAQTSPENPWPGVTWKSSDKKAVTVDANGLVTGLKKGKATITATAVDGSGKKATCEITVANLAKEISITGENTVKAGKKLKLTATVLPETTSNKKLEWTTSDKTIATVDTSGTVAAKKITEEKTVTITATAKDGSGVFTELIITVVP